MLVLKNFYFFHHTVLLIERRCGGKKYAKQKKETFNIIYNSGCGVDRDGFFYGVH